MNFEETHHNHFKYQCKMKVWRLTDTKYHRYANSDIVASPRFFVLQRVKFA